MPTPFGAIIPILSSEKSSNERSSKILTSELLKLNSELVINKLIHSGVNEIIAKPLKVGELQAKITSAMKGDRPFVRSATKATVPGQTSHEQSRMWLCSLFSYPF